MLAACLYGPGDLRIESLPVPRVDHEDEVLIRIRACGVCPTDVRSYVRDTKSRGQLPRTAVPGHEWTGEVVTTGPAVANLEPGDRVAVSWRVVCGTCTYCGRGRHNYCEQPAHERVQGGFCEYGLAPATSVRLIDDRVSFVEAAFAEPLACCLNGTRELDIGIGENVVVVGAGSIGMLHLLLAKAQGARVIVSEPMATRRKKAEELGAHDVIDPGKNDAVEAVRELTEGQGADAVIVAVGHPSAVRQGIQIAATLGRVNLFAGVYPPTEISLDPNLIHYQTVTLTGTHDFTPREFDLALKLIERRIIDVRPLVSHTFPLEQTGEAFDVVVERAGLKVMVEMA
ncbi:MAG: alcohol dehydrogenase catalytic domain-containing protein [Anaerolineae bacterium]